MRSVLEDVRAGLSARQKPFYTVEEIAEMVGRSAYTVRRWISEGRLKAGRVMGTGPRGKLLIGRDQLNRLITEGLAGRVPDAFVEGQCSEQTL
jgi:excisionase family DNA binding protein